MEVWLALGLVFFLLFPSASHPELLTAPHAGHCHLLTLPRGALLLSTVALSQVRPQTLLLSCCPASFLASLPPALPLPSALSVLLD